MRADTRVMTFRRTMVLVAAIATGPTGPARAQGSFALTRAPLGADALAPQNLVYVGRFSETRKNGFGLGPASAFAVKLDPADMLKSVRQLIAEHPAGASLRAETLARKDADFGLTGRSERAEYRLFAGRYPLCDYHLATVRTARLDDASLMGNLPPSDVLFSADYAVPSANESYRLAVQAIRDFTTGGRFRMVGKELCLKVVDHVARLAWRMRIEDGPLLYTADVGDEVFALRSAFFHVDGKATIFPHNAKDPDLQVFTLTGLKENGKLANDYFFQAVGDKSQFPLVTKDDNNFTFAIDTPEFRQTSIFTNANRVLDWFNAQGYRAFGSQRIRLIAHAVIRNDVNNAIYKPESGEDPPTIYVGDGDGVSLQNLAVDSDVVGHEFGHHVIFRTISETEGESAVLHEGIADFFTFARTGDSCLGESICPVGSRSCVLETRCLRTAANDLTYGSPNLPSDAHLRGQLISGLLWDMTTIDAIPVEDMVKITLHALDFQVPNSGYAQFILGLMHADKELYDGKYCGKIYARAGARGFGERIKGFSCGTPLPSVQGLADNDKNTNPQPPAQAKKKKKGACGVIATGPDADGPDVLFLLSAALPLVLAWRRKKPAC